MPHTSHQSASATLPAGHVAAQAAADGTELQQLPNLARGLFVRLKYGEYQLALVGAVAPPPAPGGKPQVSVQLPLDAAPGNEQPLLRTVPLSGVSGTDPLADEHWEVAGRAELQRLCAYHQQRGLVLPLADAAAAAWRKRATLVWHSLHGGKPLQEQQTQLPALLQQLQDAAGPAEAQQWLEAELLPLGTAVAAQQQQQQDQQDRQQTEQVGGSMAQQVSSPLPDGAHPARGPSSDGGQPLHSARRGSWAPGQPAPSLDERAERGRLLSPSGRARQREHSPATSRSRSRSRKKVHSQRSGRTARSRTRSPSPEKAHRRSRSRKRARSRSASGDRAHRRGRRSRSRSRFEARRPPPSPPAWRQPGRAGSAGGSPGLPLAPAFVRKFDVRSPAGAPPLFERWELTSRQARAARGRGPCHAS